MEIGNFEVLSIYNNSCIYCRYRSGFYEAVSHDCNVEIMLYKTTSVLVTNISLTITGAWINNLLSTASQQQLRNKYRILKTILVIHCISKFKHQEVVRYLNVCYCQNLNEKRTHKSTLGATIMGKVFTSLVSLRLGSSKFGSLAGKVPRVPIWLCSFLSDCNLYQEFSTISLACAEICTNTTLGFIQIQTTEH